MKSAVLLSTSLARGHHKILVFAHTFSHEDFRLSGSCKTSLQCWGNWGRCLCSNVWQWFILFGALLELSGQSQGSWYLWANAGDLTACLHLIWTHLCKPARHSKHAENSEWEEIWVCPYQTIILMLFWTSCSSLASLKGPGLLYKPGFLCLAAVQQPQERNSSPKQFSPACLGTQQGGGVVADSLLLC